MVPEASGTRHNRTNLHRDGQFSQEEYHPYTDHGYGNDWQPSLNGPRDQRRSAGEPRRVSPHPMQQEAARTHQDPMARPAVATSSVEDHTRYGDYGERPLSQPPMAQYVSRSGSTPEARRSHPTSSQVPVSKKPGQSAIPKTFKNARSKAKYPSDIRRASTLSRSNRGAKQRETLSKRNRRDSISDYPSELSDDEILPRLPALFDSYADQQKYSNSEGFSKQPLQSEQTLTDESRLTWAQKILRYFTSAQPVTSAKPPTDQVVKSRPQHPFEANLSTEGQYHPSQWAQGSIKTLPLQPKTDIKGSAGQQAHDSHTPFLRDVSGLPTDFSPEQYSSLNLEVKRAKTRHRDHPATSRRSNKVKPPGVPWSNGSRRKRENVSERPSRISRRATDQDARKVTRRYLTDGATVQRSISLPDSTVFENQHAKERNNAESNSESEDLSNLSVREKVLRFEQHNNISKPDRPFSAVRSKNRHSRSSTSVSLARYGQIGTDDSQSTLVEPIQNAHERDAINDKRADAVSSQQFLPPSSNNGPTYDGISQSDTEGEPCYPALETQSRKSSFTDPYHASELYPTGDEMSTQQIPDNALVVLDNLLDRHGNTESATVIALAARISILSMFQFFGMAHRVTLLRLFNAFYATHQALQASLRPPIPSGCARISWICVSGLSSIYIIS